MKLIVTNIQHINGRKFGHSKKFGWLAWLDSDISSTLSGWIPTSVSPAQLRIKAAATLAR